MKKLIFAGIACMITLMSGGCSDLSDDKDDNRLIIDPVEGYIPCEVEAQWPEYPLNVIGKDNASKTNEFATNLLKAIGADRKGNTSISPASIFCTLAMMANGDDDDCRDEILRLIGYSDGPDGLLELNKYCNALLAEVTDFNGQSQCGFTNSLWHRPDFNSLPSFTDDLKKIFGAAEFPIWLGDEAGRIAVNKFVREHTRGMISEFLKQPLFVDLGILNTNYFKGTWKQKFDKKDTTKGTFHNVDGSSTKVHFMTLTDYIAHADMDGIKAVRLPYAGDRYMMTLIQPDETVGIEKLVESFSKSTIDDITSYFHPDQVELRLPRFEDEFNMNIIECLKQLGLWHTCKKGLQKVSDGPLVLTDFIHAVKIKVDEEGTEGGAATMAGLLGTAYPGDTQKPILIEFDHPFIYIIRDNISDTILFTGIINSL